ncbi:MAG: hypothetical protein E7168_04565 [Firmicutes bacterium]|nr:hypothetical protein [Bacillota bacterium]
MNTKVQIKHDFEKEELKEIVDQINKEVEKDFKLIESNDGINKWNCLPILLMEEEEEQKKILDFIHYVDDLMITYSEKIEYIVTLACLIENGKLNIKELDDGIIFMLASYFKPKTVKQMLKELTLISEKDIINTVRIKTLEMDTRNKILQYIYDQFTAKKITKAYQEEFFENIINEIKETDYYDLMKKIDESEPINDEDEE